MSPIDAPVLQVRGLSKSFGTNQVLRGIDLDVPRGKVVALIGPSGSGKTTILRSLNGLETPDAGSVTVGASHTTADGSAGKDEPSGVEHNLPPLTLDFSATVSPREVAALRDRSAMVFQHYNLFPHMSVLQNVIEGPIRVQKRPRAKVIAEAERLLDRVGLLEKKDAHPFELSGGQQQRVGIVRALALKPQLLLFDEPTSALDPELVDDVLAVIKELADEGWTMVIVTHELAFARQTADEVVFMADGVVVERGPASQVLREPKEERTQQFVRRLLHEL
ncbi:amino acid ABC transporter ATP-binding protein [Arthrobacter cryoconiti]|uniref:Amino acid ABC transporter ATP-binding protein n=1 Tax=Arthrobacter cryoconiti TaxID=748907 RepID=A0ABV8R3F4_9MICC|nr:amino acid ABC transporter ATP-binding protein [Arthrobacter cryoconiti]MCC9066834.1 amino acid ABC transporter ATP-binding protein [Arthrobacter cryoconiti]